MAEESSTSDLMGLMLKRWWVLLLGIILGAGLGVLALQIVPPTYTATATQLIKGVPGSGTGAPYLAAQFAVARAKSYPAFIFSSSVLDSVRSDLGPEFTDARLRDQLTADNPTDTPLVRVTATGSSAKEAQDLANSASRHLARFITQIETVSGSTPVIVETAVQAGLPASPSSPQPTLFLALGLTGGFALGVIAVIAWGALEGRQRQKTGAANTEVQTSGVPSVAEVQAPSDSGDAPDPEPAPESPDAEPLTKQPSSEASEAEPPSSEASEAEPPISEASEAEPPSSEASEAEQIEMGTNGTTTAQVRSGSGKS